MGYGDKIRLVQDTPCLPAMPPLLSGRQQMQALDTMYRLESAIGEHWALTDVIP